MMQPDEPLFRLPPYIAHHLHLIRAKRLVSILQVLHYFTAKSAALPIVRRF